MNIPANIRVNAAFPFPALVNSTAPVTIAKANGIWTVGFAMVPLAIHSVVTPATDYVLVWDDLNQTFYRINMANLAIAIGGSGGPGTVVPRTQRAVNASPIVVQPTDMIINCNIATAATCTLPLSAGRLGQPLTLKDSGQQALAHPITVTPSGTEKIDGFSSLVIGNNGQSVTFVPFNDGSNVGWAVE